MNYPKDWRLRGVSRATDAIVGYDPQRHFAVL